MNMNNKEEEEEEEEKKKQTRSGAFLMAIKARVPVRRAHPHIQPHFTAHI